MHRAVLSLSLFVTALGTVHAAPARAEQRTSSSRPANAPASVADLVDSVKSAVVNVEVVSRVQGPQAPSGPGGDLFERFFGLDPRQGQPQRELLEQGVGSGIIIRSDGLILTNNHVVADATVIKVTLDDGRSFDAKVLGRDPLTDVALVRIDAGVKNLPTAQLGDSDAIRVGDPVVAIGNPFGLASSVSSGILSAKARVIGAGPYDDFLQTDAAINPGNSDGALFNVSGEVIGMNTAIVGGGSGIGFAVPSNLIKALLPQLEKTGAVTRGFLGIGVQDLTAALAKGLRLPVQEGALVSSLNEGSPAKRAGLAADDVIVALDGEPIDSAAALTRKVALKAPSSVVRLTVLRGDQKLTIPVTLGTRPAEEAAAKEPRSEKPVQRREKWGLSLQDVPQSLAEQQGVPRGAQVTAVDPGSAADRAGIQPGMVIVEAAGKTVRSVLDLDVALKAAKPGEVLLLRVQLPNGGKLLRALTVPDAAPKSSG
jgi:serine protease Do